MAKHRRLAEFESDRGLFAVMDRLQDRFGGEYTPADVRDMVEPRFWQAMLKAEAAFRRARGQPDGDIVRDWNKAGVPPLNGRRWTAPKLAKLMEETR